MTWQDELQNLDAELAAGRISAEEYRQRRDAVLGRAQGGQSGPASGGFPQQQPGTPSGGLPQQPGTPAGGTPQQGNPFPPAFSWGDAAAQGAQQQAQPQQQPQPGSGEATQVVPNPVANAPQPPTDSESTQVVNLNQQQQQWPAQQPPQQQQPQWGPQQGWGAVESTGTPWGDDLPGGQPEHGDASWMRQGPEVFDGAGKSGKGKLIAGLSIGGVLLVGLIVAGIFYFTSGESTTTADPEPTVQTPAPPTTKELPEPPAANPNPPANPQDVLVGVEGPAHPWNGPLDLPALQGHKSGVLQPKEVLDTAVQNGLTDGWFTKTDGPPQVTLLALRMPSPDAATTVVQKYLDAQQGLSVDENLSYKGVEVVSTGSTLRTAYVSHGWVVIIDSSGEQAEQTFKDVLARQLAQTPPTVRD